LRIHSQKFSGKPTNHQPTSIVPAKPRAPKPTADAGLSGREREADRLAQSMNRCIALILVLNRPIASSSPAFFGSRHLPSDIPQYRRVFRYASVVAWWSSA